VPNKAKGPRRVHLYAMCQLTRKEEESMLHWSTMPHSSNVKWWEEYRKAKDDYLRDNPGAFRRDPDDVASIQSLGTLMERVPTNSQLIPPPSAVPMADSPTSPRFRSY
jgi:hypothetical protein